MDEVEIWKDVEGYNGVYQVSNFGEVRNVTRHNHLLKPSYGNGHAYGHVSLSRNGKMTCCLVHRLVAIAFVENPDGKREVNHIDGNKRNNHASNLEWVTPSENHIHALKTGLRKHGEDCSYSKLTEKDVAEIRATCVPGVSGLSCTAMAKKYHVNDAVIWCIMNNRTWRWS